MGLTPPLGLGRACKVPPARCGARDAGASPLARKWQRAAKCKATSSLCAVSRASRRWSARRPDGPGEDPRLKPRMAWATALLSNSGTAPGRHGDRAAVSGAAACGCLALSSSSTDGVGGRGGGSTRAAQARDRSPSAAKRRQRE